MNQQTGGSDAITDKASDVADEFEYYFDPHIYNSARGPSNRFFSPQARS
jgi:hypothetical protein